MRFKVSDIYDYARATVLASGRFPWIEFTSAQRRTLGGQLFAGAQELVDRVGLVMQARPLLFQGYPVSGDDLLERQRRARGWRCLSSAFLLLHYWANDWHLLELTTAVNDAQAVLRQVEAEEQLPFGADPRTRWRRISLGSAFQLMERRTRIREQSGRMRRGVAGPPPRRSGARQRPMKWGSSALIQRTLREAWEQVRAAVTEMKAPADAEKGPGQG